MVPIFKSIDCSIDSICTFQTQKYREFILSGENVAAKNGHVQTHQWYLKLRTYVVVLATIRIVECHIALDGFVVLQDVQVHEVHDDGSRKVQTILWQEQRRTSS